MTIQASCHGFADYICHYIVCAQAKPDLVSHRIEYAVELNTLNILHKIEYTVVYVDWLMVCS